MAKHSITAFYETRDSADRVAEKLQAAGIPASDITIYPKTAREEYGDNVTSAPQKTEFWASLEDMFGGTDDHHTYAEGLRRGHVLLTTHVADAQLDRAVAIVEEHGSIDLDEHEETWRSEGWTGGGMAATGVAGVGAAGFAMSGSAPVTKVVTTETVTTRLSVAASQPVAKAAVPPVAKAPTVTAGRGDEDVVQVVEERLNVGKRAVSRGKVRLHSYVVERGVSEDVTLRDETVSIDRHAVDRPVAALSAYAFRERTIELEEFDEEAVVSKSVRVVEEIGIRKDVSDRVETVRDTVRSTKVDIDDERTSQGLLSLSNDELTADQNKSKAAMSEKDHVISLIQEWTGNYKQAVEWFESVPIPAFGNRTATELLEEGRLNSIIRYVERLKIGGYA